MTQEAMKLALEALEGFYEYGYDRQECFEHITAIKEALLEHAMQEVQRLGQEIEQKIGCVNHDCDQCKAQPEQEPCVHAKTPKGCYRVRCQLGDKCVDDEMSFRTAPPQRTEQEPVAHCEAGPNYCWKCLEESNPTYGSEEIKKLREVNKSLMKNIEELKKEPPPFWPVVQHLLDEYGLQFIDIVAAYREATQPEQEPVAWLSTDSIGERHLCFDKPLDNDPVQPLYTTPPQRKPLTDKAITQVIDSMPRGIRGWMSDWDLYEFAQAIEAKLKETT